MVFKIEQLSTWIFSQHYQTNCWYTHKKTHENKNTNAEHSPEGCLSFFSKEVAVVLGLELFDRNEEVSEMQLEGVGVQSSVEQTLHKARHLEHT